ncbi:MAG: hypothetical protein AAGE03_14500, partial [Pseudomonadota bacterium]
RIFRVVWWFLMISGGHSDGLVVCLVVSGGHPDGLVVCLVASGSNPLCPTRSSRFEKLQGLCPRQRHFVLYLQPKYPTS